MTFYSETARFDGTWMPQITAHAPADRMSVKAGTTRLRKGSVKVVAPEHVGLTLDELQAIYGETVK